MGNCCQKKSKDNKPQRRPPVGTGYVRITDDKVNLNNGSMPVVTSINEDGQVVTTQAADTEAGIQLDPFCVQLIQQLDLASKLEAIINRLESYQPTDLKKISDDKDPYDLFFEVKTDEAKDKFHTTYMVSKTTLSPLAFKLANSLISEDQELKISSSYERFITIFRAKIEDVFYVINYAIYKKIMLFNQKDLFFVKAFRLTPEGNVIEITVSSEHPNYPEKKGIDRMKIIENVVYYKKMDDGTTQVISLNSLYPRIGASFGILKPIFSKSFRTYQKQLGEYIESIPNDERVLEEQFVNYRPDANDL